MIMRATDLYAMVPGGSSLHRIGARHFARPGQFWVDLGEDIFLPSYMLRIGELAHWRHVAEKEPKVAAALEVLLPASMHPNPHLDCACGGKLHPMMRHGGESMVCDRCWR